MSQTLQAAYAAKRKARRFAVQGIYEWQMSHNPVHEIEARTRAENAMHKLTLTITMNCSLKWLLNMTLWMSCSSLSIDRELTALDGVELATLRLSAL